MDESAKVGPTRTARSKIPGGGSFGLGDRRRSSKGRARRIEISLRSVLIILAAVASVWLVVHIVPALIVLLGALMLVGALNPFVESLQARRVGRGAAIGIVFGVFVLASLAVVFFTVPPLVKQVETLIQNEPELRAKVVDYLQKHNFTSALADDLKNLRYDELLKSSRMTLLTVTTRVFEFVAFAVAVVFLAAYVMIDRDRLRGALFAVVPRTSHIKLSRIMVDLEGIVGGYIRGQVLTTVLMMVFIFTLLACCRVPNPLAIAVFGGVMDLLPYIGIVLTMVPAVLAALVKGPAVAATVFVLLFIYEEFEGRILIPLVYGRALRLPSSIVFFSLILGSALAGVLGALLALPAAAAILMLVEDLRVPLPGEAPQREDVVQERKDERTETEYELRAKEMPAEEAAAVAVEISKERKEEERGTERARKR